MSLGRWGRMRARVGIVEIVAIVGGLSMLSSATATAQSSTTPQSAAELGRVSGSVVDRAGRAVAGARVSVVGTALLTESDDVGGFRLSNIPAGDVRLAVRRLGFAPETLAVSVVATEAATVALALDRVSQPLPPVQVHGRRDLIGPLAGFYERLERGHGRFFTQEQLEKQTSRRMADVLRGVPGLRIETRRGGTQAVRMRGSMIAPLVWLDGVPMGAAEIDLDSFDPRAFAGIEVYSGAATVPVEFSGGRTMSTSGGTILLWTRQGEPRARTRKNDAPSPMSLILQMLDQDKVFHRDSVDTPAVLISGSEGVPIYPDSLFNAHVGGQIEVEFVVDAEGKPLMDTFGVVASTHPALVDAVRRVVGGLRYVPAVRHGKPVAQLVQLPYEFVPDGGGVGNRRPAP